VVAQNTILLGAEALDAAAALLVEEMRAELDRNAIERLERMRSAAANLHCVLTALRCTRLAYQVEPISTRRLAASTFI
jgi:hypothetical protein